jgi:hypothetical protein
MVLVPQACDSTYGMPCNSYTNFQDCLNCDGSTQCRWQAPNDESPAGYCYGIDAGRPGQ